MTTTYCNSSVPTLKKIALHLMEQGHNVGPIVIPENPWTDGNPYFTTGASNREILSALRATR